MSIKFMECLDQAIELLCEENPEEYEETIRLLCKVYNQLNAKKIK